MKKLLTIFLIIIGFSTSAQTNIKIKSLSGQEFACLLKEVAYIKFRSNYAYIISKTNQQLFRFDLYTDKWQTVVFYNDENYSQEDDNNNENNNNNNNQNNETQENQNNQTEESNNNPDLETSVDNPSKEVKINLFPNPTNQTIQIENAGENPEVKIISISGAIIKTTFENRLDLSFLSPGTYIITVNNQAFKIIKQ